MERKKNSKRLRKAVQKGMQYGKVRPFTPLLQGDQQASVPRACDNVVARKGKARAETLTVRDRS